MRINSINNMTGYKAARPNFKANAQQQTEIPRYVIDRLGLNMRTRVGYKGIQDYTPAPDNVDSFFRKLKVNWATHVDETKKKQMY